ncbi:MAG: hypothetical protein QNK37_38140 [Acidobacteriota bacterium]|nr:hypothetical protein [Acidobacteriota bacterium]
MDKLSMDLFDDTNLQADEDRIGGAVVSPCNYKLCGTYPNGTTTCITYRNCNPLDLSLDNGF